MRKTTSEDHDRIPLRHPVYGNNYSRQLLFFKILDFIDQEYPALTGNFGCTTNRLKHFTKIDLRISAINCLLCIDYNPNIA